MGGLGERSAEASELVGLVIELFAGFGEVGLQLFDAEAEGGIESGALVQRGGGFGGFLQLDRSAFQPSGAAPAHFVEEFVHGEGFFRPHVADEFRSAQLAALEELRHGARGGRTVAGSIEWLDPPEHFEAGHFGGLIPRSLIHLDEVLPAR